MDLKNGTHKIVDGAKYLGKITHITKEEKKKNSLSDEEIEKICNKPLSKVLNNVVEVLDTDTLSLLGLATKEVLERLCGKDRKRKYTCSVYAGSDEVVNRFERYLGPQKEENIRRIGICGFWHYFMNPAETDLSSLSVNEIAEGASSLSEEKKVADVIRETSQPFCSIASSLKQVKWKE